MNTATTEFAPTAQQSDFLAALVNTTDHLALVARAGCGKTSTILLGVGAILAKFPRADVVVCAYNKAIADEVSDKLVERGYRTKWLDDPATGRKVPPQVMASTLHGLGFGLVNQVLGRPTVNENKVRDIITKCAEGHNTPFNVYANWGGQIAALVGYAKGAGVGFFSDLPISSPHTWFDLADHYDVNGVDDMSTMEEIVAAAQHVYGLSLADVKSIDFDDMILFPLIKNMTVKWGKDFIFLDEAQDLSRARQALAKKFIKFRTGRMIVVGDDRQAIYGFSGADAAALPNLIQSLNATVLPLSVTWRCPKAVVRLAQTLVPDITAADAAPEGAVEYVESLPGDLQATDAILCRNTAPLISCAYSLIRRGVACKVEGRAIGDGLIKLVTRWKVKSIDALLNRIEQYRDREVQKAQAKGQESKAEEVNDRCDTLKEICNAVLAQNKHTVDDVKHFITSLFADGATNVLTLATYHRSKGREWKRVILWEHAQRCPSKYARQEWQKNQEQNLSYVAYTRAKETLVFVG